MTDSAGNDGRPRDHEAPRTSERPKAWTQSHDVQFYDAEDFLCASVADFLADGVRAGQPIVVIATEAHRRQFAEAMRGRGVEVGELLAGRDVIWLDAHETLAAFMQGPLPDAELFHATVGALFEQIQRDRRYVVVRAFGEMVDVLWRQGNVNAALAVESLWSEVAATYSFSLLCGYSMASHMTRANASAFKRICAAHARVLVSDSALNNG